MQTFKRTNKEIKMKAFGHDVVIPRGTRITNHTACGFDPSYNFIDDLSWVPKEYAALKHDIIYYGINIAPSDVEEYTHKHVDNIAVGEAIFFDGDWKTVCKKDIKRDELMGASIFGDTFKLGRDMVQVLVREKLA